MSKILKRNIKNKKPDTGFTLVELLIAVSIIGVLAGVMFNVINVGTQRNRATNAVRKATLEKSKTVIESYYAGEGKYPTATSNNPMSDPQMATYTTQWPGVEYLYEPINTLGARLMVLNVEATGCYKYDTTWAVKSIQECGIATCRIDTSDCDSTFAAVTPAPTAVVPTTIIPTPTPVPTPTPTPTPSPSATPSNVSYTNGKYTDNAGSSWQNKNIGSYLFLNRLKGCEGTGCSTNTTILEHAPSAYFAAPGPGGAGQVLVLGSRLMVHAQEFTTGSNPITVRQIDWYSCDPEAYPIYIGIHTVSTNPTTTSLSSVVITNPPANLQETLPGEAPAIQCGWLYADIPDVILNPNTKYCIYVRDDGSAPEYRVIMDSAIWPQY